MGVPITADLSSSPAGRAAGSAGGRGRGDAPAVPGALWGPSPPRSAAGPGRDVPAVPSPRAGGLSQGGQPQHTPGVCDPLQSAPEGPGSSQTPGVAALSLLLHPASHPSCRAPQTPGTPRQPLPSHPSSSPRHPSTSLPQSRGVFAVSYRNTSPWQCYPSGSRSSLSKHTSQWISARAGSCLSSCPGKSSPMSPMGFFWGFTCARGCSGLANTPRTLRFSGDKNDIIWPLLNQGFLCPEQPWCT